MPRKQGWEYAQLKADFLGDPEFQRLRGACRTDPEFLMAVGLWAISLASAWRNDDPDVSEAMMAYEYPPELNQALARAKLIPGGRLTGFEKWTAELRAKLAADAARKAAGRGNRPQESSGVQRTPEESPVGVVVVEGVVDTEVSTLSTSRERARGVEHGERVQRRPLTRIGGNG